MKTLNDYIGKLERGFGNYKIGFISSTQKRANLMLRTMIYHMDEDDKKNATILHMDDNFSLTVRYGNVLYIAISIGDEEVRGLRFDQIIYDPDIYCNKVTTCVKCKGENSLKDCLIQKLVTFSSLPECFKFLEIQSWDWQEEDTNNGK